METKLEKKKKNTPLGTILSVVFFFAYVPKLIRLAWKMGHDYTNGEDGSGFYHLTEKDETGKYKGKYRATYIIGVVATIILTAIAAMLGFYIWHSASVSKSTAAKLLTIIPSGFAAIVVCFLIFFLWAYIRGQITGLREKVAEVNEKLSQGKTLDQFGTEIK